jgi:hypothetical protein
MFFRDVFRRWRRQDGEAIPCGVAACVVIDDDAGRLLAELAADSEDFADLATVLKVELGAVLTALTGPTPPRTPDELVAVLKSMHAPAPSAAHDEPSSAVVVAADTSSLGGGEAVGWGRWARVGGGARVHHDTVEREPVKAARSAMAAS